MKHKDSLGDYSLGLGLLEIGLWESLSKVTKDWKGTSAEEVRGRLLSDKVSGLCRTMGYRHSKMVENCLEGKVVAEEGDHLAQDSKDDRKSLQSQFQEVVFGQLAKCSA